MEWKHLCTSHDERYFKYCNLWHEDTVLESCCPCSALEVLKQRSSSFLLAFPWWLDTVNIFPSLFFSYKKTSVEEYESRALNNRLSLSPSQVSTHVGAESPRCSLDRRSRSASSSSSLKSNSSYPSTTKPYSTSERDIV